MILVLLLGCLFDANWGDSLQENFDIGKIEINVEESEFHLLVEGYYIVDDSLINKLGNLSFYFVVEGSSQENEPYIFKSQRDYFKPKNIQKPLCSILIDTRNTLVVSLKIKKGMSVIAEKTITWIRPKPIATSANINTEVSEKKATLSEIEIDGLIIDETKTKAGREFYELFYSHWFAPQDARDYTIYIAEEPARGRSTIIRVSINEHIIFRQYLQSRYDVIEELSGNAIIAATRKLKKLENIKSEIQDGDQSGNGIF
jgi:curli production assembly/transport component CsgE